MDFFIYVFFTIVSYVSIGTILTGIFGQCEDVIMTMFSPSTLVFLWPLAIRNALRERWRRLEREKALGVSEQLLFSILGEKDKFEWRQRRTITIESNNKHYVVYDKAIAVYVDRAYNHSLCLVFADYKLPLYDTILMRVALLKIDPCFAESKANWILMAKPPHQIGEFLKNV